MARSPGAAPRQKRECHRPVEQPFLDRTAAAAIPGRAVQRADRPLRASAATDDNSEMKFFRLGMCSVVAVLGLASSARAIEKQSASIYHARRVALAAKLHGGVAVLFAAAEPALDFSPYRQDEDFYYLTGWNEPGAALLLVAEPESAPPALDMNASQAPRHYTEILFLPTRNLRQEKYTGVKVDAATPGAAQTVGVEAVKPMTRSEEH